MEQTLSAAASSLAHSLVSDVQKRVISNLIKLPNLGIFDNSFYSGSLWDDFCWALQNGLEIPGDGDRAFSEQLSDMVEDAASEIPRALKPLCIAYAFEELGEYDAPKDTDLANLVIENIGNFAKNRDLSHLVSTAKGRLSVAGYRDAVSFADISNGQLVWNFLLDSPSEASFVREAINRIDLSLPGDDLDIANDIFDRFIEVSKDELSPYVVARIFERFEGELRDLLIEKDIFPTISNLRQL